MPEEMLYDDTYKGPRWRYGLQYRPLATCHVPKGWIIWSDRPHSDFPAFGPVAFPRELTAEEVSGYQIVFVAKEETR